ncbi:MAG: FecR domain-containing protein [Prevotella sp.]|jgi:ferric-dicitrate binding protein FerR (iron transport regulator)|nr:FecR domain-containing protein [Prevotella sp.]
MAHNEEEKYIDKIVDLYSKSKIEGSAKDKFHKWLTDEEFAEEKDNALFTLWEQTGDVAKEDTFASFASLQYRAELRAEKKKTRLTMWRYGAAIAIVSIVAVTSAFIFMRKTSSSDVNMNEFYSQIGESDTITLPDGSIVYTNSKTVILYPKSFGKETRTIYLLGEAHFKVRKNKDIPFIVKANEFSVTALGTQFDVSSYPEDAFFKATLISGSISVRRNNHQAGYILKAGDQFVREKQTGKCAISQVDVFDATAWQRGELVFGNATIVEILNVLERNFAVYFQYEEDIFNDDKYNFHFKKSATLPEIMDVIKKVADDFEYKAAGDFYYISARR